MVVQNLLDGGAEPTNEVDNTLQRLNLILAYFLSQLIPRFFKFEITDKQPDKAWQINCFKFGKPFNFKKCT